MPGSDRGPARLPSFVIIGAMKSGTTTLGAYLSAHPDAFCAQEPHFFDLNFDKGLDWYRERFREGRSVAALGEKSPSYMYHPQAIERLAGTLPNAKLIAILRHPVDRAYSHYWHQRRTLQETLPFEDAIEAEPERLRAYPPGVCPFAYVDRGLYLEQLERVARWVDRDRLLVLLFDDLHRTPEQIYARVGAFLGIDGSFAGPPKTRSTNTYRTYHPEWLWRAMNRYRLWRRLPKPVASRLWWAMQREATYPGMDAEIRGRLLERFAEPNAALARSLDRDLSAWSA